LDAALTLTPLFNPILLFKKQILVQPKINSQILRKASLRLLENLQPETPDLQTTESKGDQTSNETDTPEQIEVIPSKVDSESNTEDAYTAKTELSPRMKLLKKILKAVVILAGISAASCLVLVYIFVAGVLGAQGSSDILVVALMLLLACFYIYFEV
jgi:hypothetical protein